METVAALIKKLQDQLANNADKSTMQYTAHQLLIALQDTPTHHQLANNVSVIMPYETEVVADNLVALVKQEIGIDLLANNPIKEISPALPMIEKQIFSSMLGESIPLKSRAEVMDQIALEPIKDLRAAIGVNDKFQFIQVLFSGDEKVFEQSIKTINAFKIEAEAKFWIKKELREKNNWEEESPVVISFDQLVKRRFLTT